MTDTKQTTRCHRFLILWMIAVFAAGRAGASDKACLTGTDPAVAADGGQIVALEAQIAETCPCASFDGSDGKARRDYLKCVSPLIKAAVKAGNLRSKCKSRVGKAHKLSNCGSVDRLPCIESKANGKLRCRITTAAKCQSDSSYTRVACASYARCIDAGDTNGDLLVAAGDSGACIVPPTATFTATGTPTFTATLTPTETSTPTPSETPLPTEPADFGWTFCADNMGTCTLPGNREVRFGHDDRYVSVFVTGTTVSCSYSVFENTGDEETPHCDYFIAEPTRTPTQSGTPTPTSTPTSTSTPEEGWVFCANEGGSCIMPSAYRLVRFGIPGSYFVEVGDSTLIDCTVAAFGVDPAFGNGFKHCEYFSSVDVLPTFTVTPTFTSTPTATATVTPTPTAAEETWTHCADAAENIPVYCDSPANRKVRFGVPGKYLYKISPGTIFCTSVWWGDPAPGEAKTCEYSSFVYPPPTPSPTPAWVFCAHPGEICMLPAHDQIVSLGIPPQDAVEGYRLIAQVSDTSIECSPSALFPDASDLPEGDCYYLTTTATYDANPFGLLVTNRTGDFGNVKMLPDPLNETFFTCNQGCLLNVDFHADFPQEIAALAVDPRITDADDHGHLSYHWTIRYGLAAGHDHQVYAPQGITGYFDPVLKIAPQSMPTLDALVDNYWRATLTITREAHTDYPMSLAPLISTYVYRFHYAGASASIAMATTCQQQTEPGPPCEIDEFLHAPEGTY